MVNAFVRGSSPSGGRGVGVALIIMDDSTVREHHKKDEVAFTRPAYREGRWEKAVKVYTINQESRYLLIQNVHALGVVDDLLQMCSLYGDVEEYRLLDEYPSEPFTDVYWVKYVSIQSARVAKRKLDNRSFFGRDLHVCYAPEFETVQDTREKLQQRRKIIAHKTREAYEKARKDLQRKDQEGQQVEATMGGGAAVCSNTTAACFSSTSTAVLGSGPAEQPPLLDVPGLPPLPHLPPPPTPPGLAQPPQPLSGLPSHSEPSTAVSVRSTALPTTTDSTTPGDIPSLQTKGRNDASRGDSFPPRRTMISRQRGGKEDSSSNATFRASGLTTHERMALHLRSKEPASRGAGPKASTLQRPSGSSELAEAGPVHSASRYCSKIALRHAKIAEEAASGLTGGQSEQQQSGIVGRTVEPAQDSGAPVECKHVPTRIPEPLCSGNKSVDASVSLVRTQMAKVMDGPAQVKLKARKRKRI